MTILIRLRSPHDIDLISLLYRDDYDLPKAVRKAVYSEARHTMQKVAVPDEWEDVQYVRKNPHMIAFQIDPEDQDVVRFISGIKKGYRCALIKSIFRTHMEHPYLVPAEAGDAAGPAPAKKKRRRRKKAANMEPQAAGKPDTPLPAKKEENEETPLDFIQNLL